MAKISTGNFGLLAPQAAPGADTTPIGRGLEDVGQAARRVALIVNDERQQAARAESANAYLDHQIGVKTAAEEVADDLASGKIAPDDAQNEYQRRVAKLKTPDIAHLTPTDRIALDRGQKRNIFDGSTVVDRQAEATRKALYRSQFVGALDKLGKLAGMPGADIEGINQQAEAFDAVGAAAGIPPDERARAIQNFKDQNWLNDAVQRELENAESIKGLDALIHDLTAEDGHYADKLDTPKRNAVLRAALSDRQQLQNRIEHAADKREAHAAVAMGRIQQQIASGIPATADMWADWANTIKGTSYAKDFDEAVKSEGQMQEILRLPLEKQVAYVNQAEANLLQHGGTLQEAANIARTKAAITESGKLLNEAPLQFQANRNGQPVVPLDLSAIGTPGSTQIAKQIEDRVATIGAMRKQYGDRIPMKPLMPEEAAVLASALNTADARHSTVLLAGVRNAVNDDEAYLGIMQQIAPDAPVKSLAGIRASQQRSQSLERRRFSNDVVATSPDVARTMLLGLDVLHPTKNAKGEDGSPKVGLYLPAEASKDLQEQFSKYVGTAFMGDSETADKAFQAVKAYYVGEAVQNGKLATNQKDVDSDAVRRAVVATLGEAVDYEGHGTVLAPWGMSRLEFEDKVQKQFTAELTRRKIDPRTAGWLDSLGLAQGKDPNTYYVTAGRNYLPGPDGKPLVIDLRQ